jgi:DNA-binding NarL/FixJ family response regulator
MANMQPTYQRAQYEEMRAEFLDRVRRFRETVQLYNQRAASHARRRSATPTSSVASSVTAPAVEASHPQRNTLTRRQLEIAELIARGYTNQQIADTLVLTPGSVANHVQHILDRLNLRSRTQVAVWVSNGPIVGSRRRSS